jgi:hypothetical protein
MDKSCPGTSFGFPLPSLTYTSVQGACARYLGRPYEAYRLYIAAHEQKFASEIVIADLVPDAILRLDTGSLKELFMEFNPDRIDDWSVRGKVSSVTELEGLMSLTRSAVVPRLCRCSRSSTESRRGHLASGWSTANTRAISKD